MELTHYKLYTLSTERFTLTMWMCRCEMLMIVKVNKIFIHPCFFMFMLSYIRTTSIMKDQKRTSTNFETSIFLFSLKHFFFLMNYKDSHDDLLNNFYQYYLLKSISVKLCVVLRKPAKT